MGKLIFFGGVGLIALALILLLVFAIKRTRYNAAAMAKAVDDLSVTIPGENVTVTLKHPPVPVQVDQMGIDYETDSSAEWGQTEETAEDVHEEDDPSTDASQPWWDSETDDPEASDEAPGPGEASAEENDQAAAADGAVEENTEAEERSEAEPAEGAAPADDIAASPEEEPEQPVPAEVPWWHAADAGSPAEQDSEGSDDLEPMEGDGSE